jgi:RNA polymerase sigma factor for flagellar operon FliA
VERSGAGDAETERRVREGRPLLELVARRVARGLAGQVRFDDLVALGWPALYEAARSWDPSRSKFTTFAAMKVRWAILDGVRRETHGRALKGRATALAASERFGAAALPAEPLPDEPLPDDAAQAELRALLDGHAAALAFGLVAAVGDMADAVDASESPEERTARAQFAVAVRRKVAALPERERALVERHYYEGEQFDAIAKDLGISKSWASRLHAQAMKRLAEAFQDAR